MYMLQSPLAIYLPDWFITTGVHPTVELWSAAPEAIPLQWEGQAERQRCHLLPCLVSLCSDAVIVNCSCVHYLCGSPSTILARDM